MCKRPRQRLPAPAGEQGWGVAGARQLGEFPCMYNVPILISKWTTDRISPHSPAKPSCGPVFTIRLVPDLDGAPTLAPPSPSFQPDPGAGLAPLRPLCLLPSGVGLPGSAFVFSLLLRDELLPNHSYSLLCPFFVFICVFMGISIGPPWKCPARCQSTLQTFSGSSQLFLTMLRAHSLQAVCLGPHPHTSLPAAPFSSRITPLAHLSQQTSYGLAFLGQGVCLRISAVMKRPLSLSCCPHRGPRISTEHSRCSLPSSGLRASVCPPVPRAACPRVRTPEAAVAPSHGRPVCEL